MRTETSPWRRSALGVALGGLHFLLSVGAAGVCVYMLLSGAGQTGWSGLYLFLLGLRWNLLFVPILDRDAIKGSAAVVIGCLFGMAVVKSIVPYWLGSVSARIFRRADESGGGT